MSLTSQINQARLFGAFAIVIAFAVFPPAAQAEPNAQKEVLDNFATLNPVPLEKAPPAAAKVAPTVTAAVKAVMTKKGKKAPAFTGTTENIEIPTPAGERRCARL